MAVRWSHCVLKVRDIDAMAQFYCDAFGWQISDRGPLNEDTEIVFLSGSSSDHHQMALSNNRDDQKGGSLDHNAFRVDTLDEVRDIMDRMAAHDGVKYSVPVTHGNAISVYFADPEGNGIEVFVDTPWHVGQPVVDKWDPAMTNDEVYAKVKATYENTDGFMPMEDYRSQRAVVFGEVTT